MGRKPGNGDNQPAVSTSPSPAASDGQGSFSVKVHQEGTGELVVAEVDAEDCADAHMYRLVVYVIRPGS